MKYILVILLIFATLYSKAQSFTVYGLVTNQITGKYLVGCSVYNISKQIGTVSNEEGKFRLTVDKGDVIQFTYIGMAAIERYIVDDAELNISMNYQVKKIKPVTIKGEIAARNSDLFNPKYDEIKNRKTPEPVRKSAKQIIQQAAPTLSDGKLVMSPITMLYYAFNKKERRRLDAIIDINKLDASNQKYSLDFISLITKEENIDELKDIKAYCYFPHDQVLNASFYSLGLMVKDCYIDYLSQKRATRILQPATDSLPQDSIPKE